MRKAILLLTALTLVLSLSVRNQQVAAQEQYVVVADGLNGPMGLLLDDSGTLWVIESGMGGDTAVAFPNRDTGTAQMGETAQVITVAGDGTKTVVTTLPSIATSEGLVGGARLAALNGKVYATVGQWLGEPTAEAGIPNMGVVAEIQPGRATAVASTWDFERAENPDGLQTDSHPYGLTANPDAGLLWVADAGGNALLSVDPISGTVSLVTAFAGLPAAEPNPARNNEAASDPVPTAVVAKDGKLYVSLLSGAPFTPGSAKVVTVDADGTVSDYATGLTMLTDLRLGPDDELYAVQFAEADANGPKPNSGALVRIAEGTDSTVVLSGLAFPTSVAFTPAGDAYLTLNGVGDPGSGQVVMYPGLATTGGAALEAATTVTATATLTDTATVSETTALTATDAATTTTSLTASAALTEVAAVTTTDEVTATAAITDTTGTTATAVLTETAAMTDSVVVTSTAATTATGTTTTTAAVEPSVTVGDQTSDGTTITITQVTAAAPGWLVIHANVEGKPGPVLGQVSVPEGTTANVVVTLSTPLRETEPVWAMLHVDAGTVGTYEFPGADSPVLVNDAIVMASLMATVSGTPAESAANAAAEPIVKEADAAGATRNADQSREPEGMPVTGLGLNDVSPTTLPIVGLILLALAGSAVISRRRQA